MGRGECPYSRWRRESLSVGGVECPYPNRRGEYPYPKKRVSLSQEERRGSLSQDERSLPNHLEEGSRLPCTTHGEGGSQVHLS